MLRFSLPIRHLPACLFAAILAHGMDLRGAAESDSSASAEIDQAWEEGATFRFNEANMRFSKLAGKPGVNERERLLGEAITLLNRQPRTRSNIADAQTILERLVRENGTDAAAVFAQYFIGRIEQSYLDPPNYEAARRTYRDLLARFPGDVMAEHAASHLVLLDLYGTISKEERLKRLTDLETLGTGLTTSQGKREFHINLGQACLDLGISDEKALEHFLLADKEGITRWQTEMTVWAIIAELARTERKRDVAIEYYKKIIAKYPSNVRTFTMKKRLESLTGVAVHGSPVPADPTAASGI
ncbi:MAG TPA: tetratricopeptide repeat protein [Chthoniobacterales bacterium]